MNSLVKIAVENWSRFWFSPQDKVLAAVFRVLFAGGLFFFYLDRYVHFDYVYGEQGSLPFEVLKKLTPPPYALPFGLIDLLSTESATRAIHLGYLAALILLGMGWWPRVLTFLIFAAHNLLVARNPMIQYGPDMVGGVWLLYLSMVDHSSMLKVPCPFRRACAKTGTDQRVSAAKSTSGSRSFGDTLHSVGIRFFQLQLCIIYAYSGIEKLRGVTWWRGDAIWNALAHGQMVTIDLSFLRYINGAVIIATYSTLAWEIYFPAIVWNRKLRSWVLAFGVALHFGIAVTMAIPYFSYFMIISYVFFLNAEAVRRIVGRVISLQSTS